MGQPERSPLAPVEGEIIPDSVLKILSFLGLSLLLGVAGAGLLWAWWTDASFADRRISTGGAFLGAGLFLVGVVGAPVMVWMLFRRTSLVLSEKCLQMVVAGTRVKMQIPYANIARFEFLRKSDHNKLQEDVIGIDLRDLGDPDTLCPGAESLKSFRNWHYFLGQGTFGMPLQQIFERILRRMNP